MDDEPIGHDDERRPADDALAARLRSSIDSDAAPVTLDEIRGRAVTPTADDPTSVGSGLGGGSGRGAGAGAVEAASAAGPNVEGGTGAARPRVLVWLGAAAAIVLLVGIGAVVAMRPAGDDGAGLDVTSGPDSTTLATSAPTSTVVAEPAPGGLYDPTSTILADRQVAAVATDGLGRIYVSYSVHSDGDVAVASESGLLVADATDGSVIADHPLVAPASALATAGPTLFLVTTGASYEQDLWRSVDGGAPALVERLPLSYLGSTLAAGDDGVWVRQPGRLQRRDPATGELDEESTDPAYSGIGTIAVDGDAGWTAAAGQRSGPRSSDLVPFEGATPGAVVGSEPVGPLAMVDGTLVAAIAGSHLVVTPPGAPATTAVEANQTIQAIGGRSGRVWAVTNDLAASPDIGVVTFALGGEPAWLEVGFDGVLPRLAAIDGDHALVCGLVLDGGERPAESIIGAGADGELSWPGSACRLLDARTSPAAAPPPPTTAPSGAVSTTVTAPAPS